MAHLYIAATQKSSGKTTLSIGLARELGRRGLTPRPFKKGPDYIDPLWLAQATGRTCFNLDFHTMARDEIRALFARQLGAGLGLIEGNVGLFDDVDIAGSTSNAELAKLLGAPVVLVIDCHGMARGIAPLLLGYQAFDRDLRIAGVVLNKVGSARHAATLRRAVEHFTDLPVLGVVRRAEEIQIAERHLGLIPVNEAGQAEAQIEAIRAFVADQVDVERILAVAATAERPAPVPGSALPEPTYPGLRIGIARDEVFGFYYPDDLLAFTAAGAELIDFSPLHDAVLPEVDALFIGGGFPECRMADLEANRAMRAAVADFAAAGRPVYAECGGLMYLSRHLHWGEQRNAMCGVLSADVAMHTRPQGLGYVRLSETDAFPWPSIAAAAGEVRAHEFHHSAIVDPAPDWRYAYAVQRGTGIDGRHDGIVQQRVLACYSHLRGVGGSDWPRRFLAYVAASRR
ncbi:cobyrinic acid a,c-diamide synthase [Thioflavicoccus mobilis 8321]|uniref:Cobyrinate a,c-diamide synthase n=1 Tax=Thioflavicoccus mobilis 8321 TaxID=765912 RepID=L0GUJ9_9GAMM|nr:cobyrinate a,c-diamide synthase [Thioflavicoccus mobilis]AGA89030.1 cobyrinic acid a,c-diamide synthase [Thioflavicoccus mobilis 8321]